MDRKTLLLAAAAVPLGLAGGYAWSVLTAPPPKAYVPPKPTIATIASSPEDYPAAVDEEWESRSSDAPTSPKPAKAQPGCSADTEGDGDIVC
jgi:hypothetical protein